MAKKVSNSFIKELVATADIVDVVSRYVNLKKQAKTIKVVVLFIMKKHHHFLLIQRKIFIIVLAVRHLEMH